MTLTTRPPTPAPARDLTDAEFAELDDLLAETPEPLEPLDVVMLDGYLCGAIVQPAASGKKKKRMVTGISVVAT